MAREHGISDSFLGGGEPADMNLAAPFAADLWSSNSGGSWGTPANWSNGEPTTTDDVQIAVAGITVTVGTGVAADAGTMEVTNSTLDIDGGTLYTVQSATFRGAFDMSAGTYTMTGYGASFYDPVSFSGGTIDALSGNVELIDGGVLSGTLTGAGALDVVSGVTYINAGFSATISSIVVGLNNGQLGFDTNFTYAKNFTELQNGVIDLFGHTLTLTGPTLLEGVVGNGKLVESATMTLGNPTFTTYLDNGLVLDDTGTIVQNGNIAMGANDSGARIVVAKSGKYFLNSNWSLSNPATVATINDAGLFEKEAGGKTSLITASFTSTSTGTVAVQIGTLLLDGLVNSLAGTMSGAGTLAVSGGQTTLASKIALNVATFAQQGGLLLVNHPLTYGGTWDMTGGVLDLNGTAAKLTLAGLVNLDGGTLTSFGGTMAINGTANFADVVIGGPTTLLIDGTVDQTASIGFGYSSNPTADIAAGASWVLEGDSAILGSFGLINNSGTFIDPNGSGDALVQCEFVNSGTLTVDNSTLTLAGISTLGGTLNGTGLLDLAGPTQLASGVAMTVAALAVDNASIALSGNLSYANIFIESGNNGALYLDGYTLTLTGRTSLDSGVLAGGGTLVASGATVIGNYAVGGASSLEISGTAEQSGSLNLGPQQGEGDLVIEAGASYTLDDDDYIYGGGAVVNNGTFTASSTGTSQIDAILFAASSGTIRVNDQTLQLADGGYLAGSISGAGTLQLDGNSSVYQVQSGLGITTGGLQVSNNITLALTAGASYGGDFQLNGGIIELGTNTLSLTGTTTISSGILDGPLTGGGTGTLVASGSTTLSSLIVQSGAVLSITGTAEQSGNVYVGEQSGLTQPASPEELVVAAGATYTLDANASILNNGTLLVAGTLVASGDGSGTLATTVVDNGVIAANLGTLDILSAVGGSGVFSIGTGGLLQFANTATFGGSNDINFTAGGGALTLDDPATFAATLVNFSTGDSIGLANFNEASLTGTYANGADTQITFSDGQGDSVTLTFSTAQTLTNFHYETGPQGLATILHT